jgi:hypothetical protein
MHKKTPVVDLTVDETGFFSKISKVHDLRHLPLGVPVFKTGIDRKSLNDWWTGRAIPAGRSGLQDALFALGLASPTYLLEKCYGLSLSDQYWICPKGSGLEWENVNFFTNGFSRDVGEILFGHEPRDWANISLFSPDNTSDGWLKKKWVIADGKRLLMKGGSGLLRQEPYNEVAASAIMRRLGIDHAPYTLTLEDDKPYSLCENFVSADTELIPAGRILQTKKQPNSVALLPHFLDCCDALGIHSVQPALDKMLTVDYLIANEDRHWNNFGLIRNAETLEWQGFAPIYDSGTSLWYNSRQVGMPIESKPFRKSHEEQIQLVSDLSWFHASTLDGIGEEIMDIFNTSPDVDAERRKAIADAVDKRAKQIEQLRLSARAGILDRLHGHQQAIAETPETPDGKKHEQSL